MRTPRNRRESVRRERAAWRAGRNAGAVTAQNVVMRVFIATPPGATRTVLADMVRTIAKDVRATKQPRNP